MRRPVHSLMVLIVTWSKLTIRPCLHLTCASAFFFDLCRQMETLSMNTIICCHRTHSRSLTRTQTSSVNKALPGLAIIDLKE